ncbi:dTMP kinase [Candidatus Daviesbacteria bacterium]|nr:dTMP kinase [Candidatus Daviesbacteria bacterium]
MRQGKLIVVEGIDGSGKSTQVELLKQALNCEIISFPRYEDNEYGRLIKNYLEGEFGSINEVDPYKIACLFAGDRLLAKPIIEKWLSEGKIVIANRYVSASKAHMGANLPEGKREDFFKWLGELEYQTNGIPKEDLTILLKVDPVVAQKNVKGGGPDIHEENLRHLEEAGRIYLYLAKNNPKWYVVDCMQDSNMRSIEEISKEVINICLKLI